MRRLARFLSTRLSALLLALLLAACPQPDDPGRKEIPPEPVRIEFPTDRPTRPERIELYVRLLESARAPEVRWATAQLAVVGAEALPALENALAERGPRNLDFVINGLQAIEAMGLPAGAPLAARWIEEDLSTVRERAVAALGECGGPVAAAALEKALADESTRVVGRALLALAAARPEGGAEVILAARERLGDGLQGLAARALGELGDPAARAWLRKIVETGSRLDDRLEAATALRRLGDEHGVEVVAAGVPDAGHEAWTALVSFLLEIEDPRGRQALSVGRVSEHPIRKREAQALSLSHPAAGFEEDVLEALAEEDPILRRFALTQAGRWLEAGSPPVEAAVLALLKASDDPVSRVHAANALVGSEKPHLLDRVRDELRDRPGSGTGLGTVSFNLGRALAHAGEDGFDRLAPLLSSSRVETVIGAISGLEVLPSTDGARLVLGLLGREEIAIRLAAAEAMSLLGSRSDLDVLRAVFLRETDDTVRRAIASSARRILDAAGER